jgi:pimeloyl-ACP methyl ester carboxylesterase
VVEGQVPIAVYDYGGTGADVVLLHGGARTGRDWDAVAELLVAHGFRAVAMDLRGHGATPVAPWSWSAALDDLAAVVRELQLDRPAVVGHSLGGMIAALWAEQHVDCRLAVNLDGHGNPTRPDQYAGLDAGAAVAAHAALTKALAPMAEGLSVTMWQVMREIDALDLYAVYRSARCPLVVVSGRAADFAGMFPPEAATAWLAYVRWVEHQLAAAERETPRLTLTSLPMRHDVLLDDPEAIMDVVSTYVPPALEGREP